MDENFRNLVMAVVGAFAFGLLLGAAIVGSHLPVTHLTREERL